MIAYLKYNHVYELQIEDEVELKDITSLRSIHLLAKLEQNLELDQCTFITKLQL